MSKWKWILVGIYKWGFQDTEKKLVIIKRDLNQFVMCHSNCSEVRRISFARLGINKMNKYQPLIKGILIWFCISNELIHCKVVVLIESLYILAFCHIKKIRIY